MSTKFLEQAKARLRGPVVPMTTPIGVDGAVDHEEGWSVTLHMQRARSLADPSNQHWIRTYCEQYPNMALILDHAATCLGCK